MVKKKVIVLSLGGSLIIPDKINYNYIEKFKQVVRRHYKTHKFVVVCGGGAIARAYIDALKNETHNQKEISQAGIRATRMNALFMIQFFGKEANEVLPKDMEEVKANIHKNDIIFCGALRWAPRSTSDGTASKLAHYLKSEFINLTNVKGLYTDNPKTHKNAKFIPSIDWKSFEKMANKSKYTPGQHFVLDQKASSIIRKYKIRTYIIGEDLKQLENVLEGKKFIGTTISN